MPFFSVIIPTFNRAVKVTEAVHSVLAQQFSDFEIIVIDDGSEDETGVTLAAISDERLKYHFQPNAERGAARNKGVTLASGQYVFFLDSDDMLYPGHLQHAQEMLKRLNNPEFFHIRYQVQSDNRRIRQEQLSAQSIRKKALIRNRFACQFFLRRDIAVEFQFSENRNLKIGEDWEVVIKLAVRFPLYFSNQCHALIRQHPDRTMNLASYEVVLKSREILLENLRHDRLVSADSSILDNVWCELTSLAALSAVLHHNKPKAQELFNEVLRVRRSIFFSRRGIAIKRRLLFS